MRLRAGKLYDKGGKIAAKGKVDQRILAKLLKDEYFSSKPPKSLDRDHFTKSVTELFGGQQPPRRRASDPPVKSAGFLLSPEDGAATLSAFTVGAIKKACDFLPQKQPAKWFVCGGGRHNPQIMSGLAKKPERQRGGKNRGARLQHGDVLEAQAFGFLAVRSYLGMPLSLPETTGVKRLVTGGAFYRA